MTLFSLSTATLPIILLTDFGSGDPYVGQMKGVLARQAPGALVIDLFHDISPYHIKSGAWLLERCWPHMPRPAVWLCVVDPGVGSGRRGLVVEAGGSFFVGPDNGLFTHPLSLAGAKALVLDEMTGGENGVSPTFHGRDLFAPVAARLAAGTASKGLGSPVFSPPPVTFADPGWRGGFNEWEAEVILVDRYGNLVTTLPGTEVSGRQAQGEIDGRPCGALVTTFASVAPGACAMVVGGFGTVEVVVNQGSAREMFSAGLGTKLRVRAAF
ncbi:MAG: SAM-dependent chlorinase/fluorinase [Magnetococcales bacterium]|nr:SAM-dependent chlorinase/fluorinase [Magnetococcales bacterium]